jgi:hypothetical protein
VRIIPIRVSLLSAALCLTVLPLAGQDWNAATLARSWAKQDKDDSFTFYDAPSRTLHTWARDGGLMGSVSVGKLDPLPDHWVMDPRNNAWVTYGTGLAQLDRTGHTLTSSKLPAEVGDLAWDTKGFILSFQSPEPYLEKRDFKGALLWSFGSKPARNDGPAAQNLRPIILNAAGNVLMADGTSLNLSYLDAETGRKTGETHFVLPSGQPVPPLVGNGLARGPLASWPGKNVVFAALRAAQVPPLLRGVMQGLVLARLDLATSQVEFLPTGLDETHLLIGILDSDAVFVSPKGGLMLVKVR